MGANMHTPVAEIERYLQKQIARRERAIIHTLAYAGEECVNAARTWGSYLDRTGNLRSSTGYLIVVDGKIFHISDFEPVKESGATGSKDGKAFARTLAGEFPKGIVLIVVAGMKYAACVSARGKDVLDRAELTAQSLVSKLLQQLTR
jgi:hypothetical protein